jgi:cell shape-determining protein MreC
MHTLIPILFTIVLSLTSNHKVGIYLQQTAAGIISPITRPLKDIRHVLSTNTSTLYNFRQLKSQNIDLIIENSELKSQIQEIITETDSLTMTQTDSTASTYPIIDYYPQVLIRADHTILPQTPVTSGSILLGYTKSSKNLVTPITPLTAITTKVPVITSSGLSGNIISQDGDLILTDVQSGTPLTLGDTVFTRVSIDTIPHLVIGEITKIISRPADPIQKAIITPPLFLSSQKVVELKTQKNTPSQ